MVKSEFTLNSQVQAIVTTAGARMHNEYFVGITGDVSQRLEAGDVHTWVLWEFMRAFGPHLSMGGPQFLEDNKITFLPDETSKNTSPPGIQVRILDGKPGAPEVELVLVAEGNSRIGWDGLVSGTEYARFQYEADARAFAKAHDLLVVDTYRRIITFSWDDEHGPDSKGYVVCPGSYYDCLQLAKAAGMHARFEHGGPSDGKFIRYEDNDSCGDS